MSRPISATMTRAIVCRMPGMVMSRSTALLTGREGFAQAHLHVAHGDLERINLRQMQAQQKAMVGSHAATQGSDDGRARGFQPT
jgi:hypothetical protein